jgi:hypothetical protein
VLRLSSQDAVSRIPERVSVKLQGIEEGDAGELADVVLAQRNQRKAPGDDLVIFRFVLEEGFG